MQSSFDIIYDVIFRPREAFTAFQDCAPWKLAMGVMILSTGLPSFIICTGIDEPILSHIMAFLLVGEIFVSLIGWGISTGVYHLIAEIAGGHGRILSLFSALGFAHLPYMAILPLFALSGLLSGGLQTLWLAGTAFVVLGWNWLLYYYAVKGVYCLSGSKTILVLCAPLLVGLLIIVFMAVFLSVWLAQISFGSL